MEACRAEMNIFALDEHPATAASYMCNKHVVKMVLESTQILSTVAQLKGFSGPYKKTHVNHPVVLWTMKSDANWFWLVTHAMHLCTEYRNRYNKKHKCESLIWILWTQGFSICGVESWDYHTPFEQCMPEQYRQENAVQAYRAYYMGEKAGFAKWKEPSKKPDWFIL